MTLKEFMRGMNDAQRLEFAQRAGTSVGILFQIRAGLVHPSLERAIEIERATFGKVKAETLRPASAETLAYIRCAA
jgi:DNA-binding transcriptional regulator YdaS (Cro superfamily)